MIPITRPLMGEAEADAARETVLSGWVSQGPQVAAFEREFAAAVGAPYAVAVANCTVSLHLALLAVGVGPGDEVITVSHSFIATANSILYCGAEPVFVDIDPITFNIDPQAVAAAITARTRAILVVHQVGMPCALGEVRRIADAHGIPLVEDAACAIGAEVCLDDGNWQRIGRPHGRIACFSLHPRKIISTGEGGLITTADPHLDQMLRHARQHGMTVNDLVRHGSTKAIFEAYPTVGYNYRMTDIQAAIGRQQLRRLPEIVTARRALAAVYGELLVDRVPDVAPPAEPAWARSNWQSYCVRLPEEVEQETVMQAMLDRGVSTRRGIMCSHMEGAYLERPLRFALPHSEWARNHTILLPLFPQMTQGDQETVVDALRQAIDMAGVSVGRGSPVLAATGASA